ncbi:NAD-dependent epimerase/dehydratase family protein [Alkalimonas delamerensis]|uniref:NAD-dependent epimerase/dehydratase family protein n=1 Tax=Alkalimonas delamerensis TaxID=265981 RepID=A0ABT9GPV0_9GAMM|nr:NAD-dependent epimerase/dehydratase family protein [Alkalimonas delamerensis]MDP4528989.1 NAD-dependent epimerase/dehydratase family protein [Alkalimonas delamerensis]
MKVLVTGAAGFIGSHVADALTNAGHEVTLFDMRPSPYRTDNQHEVVGDLMNMDFMQQVVAGHDVVFHLAGIADIDECKVKPVDTARVNVLGTVQLLEVCKQQAIKRFVFASSAYVYSDSGFFYRSSKQACESFIENYAELYGLKYTCLRYGSLYGPRADMRNGIYRLVRQAIETGRIEYTGTGKEQREFIHVLDAAESSVKVLEPEFENTHITLTGKERMSFEDLLAMLNEMLGNNIEICIKPGTRKAHYKITPYNFSPKMGRKLVNNPHVDMGQGLLQCLGELYEAIHQEKENELGVIVDK